MSDCRFGVSPVNYPDPERKDFAVTFNELHNNLYSLLYWYPFVIVRKKKKKKKKKTIKAFHPLKEEEELVSQLQKLNRLRNLMVSLRTCSAKMIIVRSHFSVGRSLSWMTLLFQMRV